MKAALLVISGAVLSVLAFPPFGPGVLILAGVAFFLSGLRLARNRRQGLLLGALYGFAFYGGLMWWLTVLDPLALILVPAQASFLIAYGWWISKYGDREPVVWLLLAVGGWGLMEAIRYRFPIGGLEWGGAGYALSDMSATRFAAWAVGTSGLTVLVALVGALGALALTRSWERRLVWAAPVLLVPLLAAVPSLISSPDGPAIDVVVVQGSTPCPFEHCPPNERLRTYQQHLELTRTIPPGSAELVVWSESSTGSTNADPVLNAEVREAIAAEAQRIGAWMLIGGDRHFSDTEWVNANVVFNPGGEIVGEYRKQHPVPFGEYIPARSIFGKIPALAAVPRDMVPGEGAVVFPEVGGFRLGSVISFEGGFSRYGVQHARAGANILVIATNEASYDYTPASDQFIGMTRMRAVELGMPLIHAAVTGKSAGVDAQGRITGITDLGTQELLELEASPGLRGPFSVTGDVFLYISALVGVLMWWRSRSLVGSADASQEEE